MNITDFPALQQHFNALIRRRAKSVQILKPGTTETVPLEFVKPDYSSIAQSFPVHKIRISFKAEQTIDEFLDSVGAFLSNLTPELPAIVYCSPLYLDYDPTWTELPTVVAFDLAAMTYDGMVVTYPIVTGTGDRYASSGAYWSIKHYSVFHKHAKHTLLKKQAVEINVWVPNITARVAQSLPEGAAARLRAIREDFDNNAADARLQLSRLLDFATMQDQVLQNLAGKTVDGLPSGTQREACIAVIAAVLGVPVEVEVLGGQVFIVIEGHKVPPNELFNYAANAGYKNV